MVVSVKNTGRGGFVEISAILHGYDALAWKLDMGRQIIDVQEGVERCGGGFRMTGRVQAPFSAAGKLRLEAGTVLTPFVTSLQVPLCDFGGGPARLCSSGMYREWDLNRQESAIVWTVMLCRERTRAAGRDFGRLPDSLMALIIHFIFQRVRI